MNQLPTLALLMSSPAKFYEHKPTLREIGYLGGAVLRERKLRRIATIRPRMLDMLKGYRTYSEMAQEIGVSKVTVQKYIKNDPEMKRLASLYVKVGGCRKRSAR